MKPLKIGLNLVYLQRDSGGSARYARELIRGILVAEPDSEITGFLSRDAPADLLAESWGGRTTWVRFPVPGSGAPWHFGVELGSIVLAARRRNLDVVHGLANVAPLVSLGPATVVTLLDVTWMHDPSSVNARFRLVMSRLAPACARAADRAIAISHHAKADLVETFGLDPASIDVTHLGATAVPGGPTLPEAELRRRLALGPGPLVICIAQKRTHKNLHTLVRAFAELSDPAAQLVLPGSPTDYEQELRRLATELGVASRVALPAWLEDSELEALYAAATCFVLPSFHEGFGLPVLEAMARGVPVVCSDAGALAEVAGGAALLFDPHRVEELTAAMGRVLSDSALRESLVARGHARCAELTWERTATETLAVYRRAIAARLGR